MLCCIPRDCKETETGDLWNIDEVGRKDVWKPVQQIHAAGKNIKGPFHYRSFCLEFPIIKVRQSWERAVKNENSNTGLKEFENN